MTYRGFLSDNTIPSEASPTVQWQVNVCNEMDIRYDQALTTQIAQAKRSRSYSIAKLPVIEGEAMSRVEVM